MFCSLRSLPGLRVPILNHSLNPTDFPFRAANPSAKAKSYAPRMLPCGLFWLLCFAEIALNRRKSQMVYRHDC
jgi:hypothetical protein